MHTHVDQRNNINPNPEDIHTLHAHTHNYNEIGHFTKYFHSLFHSLSLSRSLWVNGRV